MSRRTLDLCIVGTFAACMALETISFAMWTRYTSGLVGGLGSVLLFVVMIERDMLHRHLWLKPVLIITILLVSVVILRGAYQFGFVVNRP